MVTATKPAAAKRATAPRTTPAKSTTAGSHITHIIEGTAAMQRPLKPAQMELLCRTFEGWGIPLQPGNNTIHLNLRMPAGGAKRRV